ncbi:hypothetical protein C8046_04480 [Serinibacter arcticus]|uniref:DUF5302 domain-containing protein n=1 Tax=Serinibacter arcticus TaxID=1655435 RepID=A0A2U1ZSS6_9MICO|nr:DUF5302 domain-containing protein [Serinibacter arcticus]PWD50038.1 hypothetical protein C8046_04480 [Serinibacter arcticus]
MTAQNDETPTQKDTGTSDAETTAGAPTDDVKERFRAALEAKRAGQQTRGGGAQDRDQLAGHAKDGAHGHKVFRRKSG